MRSKLKILSLLIIIFIFSINLNKNKVNNTNSYLALNLISSGNRYIVDNNLIKTGYDNDTLNNLVSDFQIDSSKVSANCNNSSTYLGTGCPISIIDNQYNMIVIGDVNGDGSRTITDMVKIAMYAEDNSTLSNDYYKIAADVNQDDSISSNDTTSLATYTINKNNISVKSGIEEEKSTITLSKQEITINKNKTTEVVASVNKSGVNIVSWKSANENVAVVDSNGLITGVGGGSTTITVTTSDDATASVSVTVNVIVPVTGITLNKSSSSINAGDSETLVATISPSDASNKDVTWTSSNTSIATVDKNGKIIGIANGNVTITATSNNGLSASTNINVIKYATSVKLNKTSAEMSIGNTITLSATVSPSTALQTVTWISSNTDVVTVNSNGKVTAISGGKATITVTTNGSNYKETCDVTVLNGYTVLINPSHQTQNETKSSNSDYNTEKKSMFKLAKNFKKRLESNGYVVYLSPSSGSISSNDRCYDGTEYSGWTTCGVRQITYLINKHNDSKTVYLALHSNASNGSAMGPIVFYYVDGNGSKTFATKICNRLINLYKNKGYTSLKYSKSTCVANGQGTSDEAKKYYLNGGKGVAVLVEVGFHDNSTNQSFIENNLDNISKAMLNSIKDYTG